MAQYLREFGFCYWLKNYTLRALNKLFHTKNSRPFLDKLFEVRKNYLYKRFGNIYQSYANNFSVGDSITNDAPIWVFWWQGEDNAPETVKYCLSSIKHYSNKRKVHVLTEDNYSNYVSIPEHIMNLLHDKKISITLFSDILRVTLLAQYGGIWVDATILLTDDAFKLMEGYKFYSLKHDYDSSYVSKCRWTSYCLACGKNNQLFSLVRDVFYEYFKKYDTMIDYLLVDYIFALAYDNIIQVKEMIDNVPKTHNNVEKFKLFLSEKFSDEVYNELTKEDCIFKLSWKDKFCTEKDGCPTLYKVKLVDKWKE